jgi:tetratricopeptide (TPR) repeat protein
MGPHSRAALYCPRFSYLMRICALINRTRTILSGLRSGLATGIRMPSLGPIPARLLELPLRVLRSGSFLLLFFGIPAGAPAQENLSPQLETKLAPGVQSLKSGDLDSAERVFSDALRQGIKHPLVYHNLGVIAQLRGKHLEAVQRFRQALALLPDYGPSRLLLGSSLLALHRNSEALPELQRAVSLMPQQPQAHLQLAKAYEAKENWMAAVQQLQILVALAPQEPDYSYQLGTAWAKLSVWSMNQVSTINPQSARLQQALGLEYAMQEKYDLALAAYQHAARSAPKLPELHLAMALILLEQRKFDAALEEINLELNLVPESSAAAATRARIEAAKAAALP